ncbi:endocuticle structural protein SgAbd-6-like [Calliphora vicina]|uniref:endocuticle structural protein SgAbd-6-like n=1 Tax=Calliphora vicina TaxID=7373 RepID=UPI00325C17B7
MFKCFVFIAVLAVTTAASIGNNKDSTYVPILRQGEEKTDDGSFTYYYESADGAKRQEVGIVKNAGTDEETLVVKGSWSYFDQNGNEVIVEYIADENGFQPQGTHIPQVISQAAHDAAQRSILQQTNKQ